MAKQNTAPTMKDVAKEAGVSLGTVSKVINGIPVGDEYRKKVEQAIKTLDYHINAYAKGLKNNRTYTRSFCPICSTLSLVWWHTTSTGRW